MFLVGLSNLLGILAIRPARVPHILAMAKRGIEDAALAVFLAPGDWIYSRRGILNVGLLIEGQQPVHFRRIKVLYLVNLVEHLTILAQMSADRAFGILVDGLDFELGGVGLEMAANHVGIARKAWKCVRGGVHPHEALA